ncbi:1,4-dihydroxy-2-naphthoate octaprenyltransferase [Maribacter sp. 2307ULW6-5]|uniref:1,4-dihydroxy-2-naphthoate octaprenyltransferase n=1 Tax=Maribacter sp. 2307ULW6-5 TaxID=3386275 RepID=UPI0039BC5947
MGGIRTWLDAARPRTLPLSISGVVVGAGLASYFGQYNGWIFLLSLLTTIGFQVTSNFANDYGDGVKGTDNEDRIGPARALQSGQLTQSTLKRGIVLSVAINVLLVVGLLYVSFDGDDLPLALFFLILGGCSIWAAIRYTVGDSAYGYRGLGDVFVFVFFGLVGVLGSMFLHTKQVPIISVPWAIAIGLLSVGVLNLNNLRDHVSDKKAGKNTLVVKMGFGWGKKYHFALLAISFFCVLAFIGSTYGSGWEFLIMTAFLPIAVHLRRLMGLTEEKLIDKELKILALSTFALALVFYIFYHNKMPI